MSTLFQFSLTGKFHIHQDSNVHLIVTQDIRKVYICKFINISFSGYPIKVEDLKMFKYLAINVMCDLLSKYFSAIDYYELLDISTAIVWTYIGDTFENSSQHYNVPQYNTPATVDTILKYVMYLLDKHGLSLKF